MRRREMGNPGSLLSELLDLKKSTKLTFFGFVSVEVAVRDYATSLQRFYCNNANSGLQELLGKFSKRRWRFGRYEPVRIKAES